MTRRRSLLALAAAMAAMRLPAAAQPSTVPQIGRRDFPSRSVTLVVPYPPGGSNDLFARELGRRLGHAWRVPVSVENRSGDSGTTGAASVSRAAPDGYTLCLLSSSFATNAAIQPSLPFDPVEGFTPIGMVAKGPLVLAVARSLPARTTLELFDLARRHPGKLTYGSSGVGSVNHFATELLMDAAQISLAHVPYDGMGPAVTELIGGHVDLLMASAASLYPHVKAGRVRAIGVTGSEHSPLMPELQPLASMGLPAYRFELWWGMLAPPGMPPALAERINADLNRILAQREVRAIFLRHGAEPAPTTPARFAHLIAAEIAIWRKVARSAGIRPD